MDQSIKDAVEQLARAIGPAPSLYITNEAFEEAREQGTMQGSGIIGFTAAYHPQVFARGRTIVLQDTGRKGDVHDQVSWDVETFARVVLPAIAEALSADED